MNSLISLIAGLIQLGQESRQIDGEKANLLEGVLKLEGSELILANRLITRGADPYALEYYLKGKVSPHIEAAHFGGPGSLTGDDKNDWLLKAYHSADEFAQANATVRERLEGFLSGAEELQGLVSVEYDQDPERNAKKIASMEEEIKSLPFTRQILGGVEMRLYTSDLGFAAAYWSGEEFAAVKASDGLTFIGSDKTGGGRPLPEIGIKVDKELKRDEEPCHFGIIFPENQQGVNKQTLLELAQSVLQES